MYVMSNLNIIDNFEAQVNNDKYMYKWNEKGKRDTGIRKGNRKN